MARREAKKPSSVRIAAVQATPVFLDRDATVDKACKLIAEAGRDGARLAVFPEAFVPGYPDWVWSVPVSSIGLHRELHTQLVNNSIAVPGPETEKLCRAAKRAKLNVVIGINERNAEASDATLYNTIIYIDESGALLGKHRKLIPTGAERLVWGQGDGSTLDAYDLPFGKVGGLICWENYMPLARFAMYAWGTQVYVAPTWDRSESWNTALRHIAREGGMYVIGCCMALRKKDITAKYRLSDFYANVPDWINVGNSAIVGPDGAYVEGPIAEKESIIYADADLDGLPGPKWLFDVAGHYARPDVFQLMIDREPRPMVSTNGSIAPRARERAPATKKPRRTKR
jgi:nitrilase